MKKAEFTLPLLVCFFVVALCGVSMRYARVWAEPLPSTLPSDEVGSPADLGQVLSRKLKSLGLDRPNRLTDLQIDAATEKWQAWLRDSRFTGQKVKWRMAILNIEEEHSRSAPFRPAVAETRRIMKNAQREYQRRSNERREMRRKHGQDLRKDAYQREYRRKVYREREQNEKRYVDRDKRHYEEAQAAYEQALGRYNRADQYCIKISGRAEPSELMAVVVTAWGSKEDKDRFTKFARGSAVNIVGIVQKLDFTPNPEAAKAQHGPGLLLALVLNECRLYQADLVSRSGRLNKTEAYPGEQIQFTGVIENLGGASSQAGSVYFYWKAKPRVYSTKYRVGTRRYGSMAPGMKSDLVLLFTIPDSAPPGVYYLYRWVDATHSTEESDETNNSYYNRITVLPSKDPETKDREARTRAVVFEFGPKPKSEVLTVPIGRRVPLTAARVTVKSHTGRMTDAYSTPDGLRIVTIELANRVGESQAKTLTYGELKAPEDNRWFRLTTSDGAVLIRYGFARQGPRGLMGVRLLFFAEKE